MAAKPTLQSVPRQIRSKLHLVCPQHALYPFLVASSAGEIRVVTTWPCLVLSRRARWGWLWVGATPAACRQKGPFSVGGHVMAVESSTYPLRSLRIKWLFLLMVPRLPTPAPYRPSVSSSAGAEMTMGSCMFQPCLPLRCLAALADSLLRQGHKHAVVPHPCPQPPQSLPRARRAALPRALARAAPPRRAAAAALPRRRRHRRPAPLPRAQAR